MNYEKLAFKILSDMCNQPLENLENLKKSKKFKKIPHQTVTILEKLCGASPQESELQQMICSVIDSIRLKKSFPKFKNQWCDLSFLICSSFNLEDVSVYINSEDYCNKPELCTDIGKKLSNSLVKIASTRIFSNPEQSILELPVNSLDAYGKGSNVGKFGMGFFSILYWLVGHPQRRLIIDSCYTNESGGLDKYTCLLKYSDEKLMFKLENESSREIPGATISLYCSKDQFSQNNLEQFSKQLNKLKYTNSAGIYVKTEGNAGYQIFNQCKSCDDKVFVLYESNGIRVSDDATGIPLEVLLLKLFTPSISTKTITLSQIIHTSYQNQSSFAQSEDNHFIILVNKVAIVDIPFSNQDTNKYTVIIDLPPNTRVPVSRDDIIIDQMTLNNINTSLINISQTSVSQFRSLYALNSAINAYTIYSVNSYNKEVFNNIWSSIKNQFSRQSIFIDYTFEYLYQQIPLSIPYITIDKTNVKLLEDYLSKEVHFDSSIFVSKNVVYLHNVKNFSSSGGTSSFIFVQHSFTQKGVEWPMQLSLTNLSDTLIPKSNTTVSHSPFSSILSGQRLSDFTTELYSFLPNFRDKDSLGNKLRGKYLKLLNLFGLKFLALETRFTIDRWDVIKPFIVTASSIYKAIDYDNTELFLNLYMDRFGLLRPTLAYSQGKPNFYNFYSTILFDNYFGLKPFRFLYISDKLKQFTVEWSKYFSKMDIHSNTFLEEYSYQPLWLVNMYFINSPQAGVQFCHDHIFKHRRIFLQKPPDKSDSEDYANQETSSKISFILSLAIDECESSFELNLIYQLLQLLHMNSHEEEEKIDYIDMIFQLSNSDIKSLSKFTIEVAKLNYVDIKTLYGENPRITEARRTLKLSWRRIFLVDVSVLNYLLTSFKMKIQELNQNEDLPKANLSVFSLLPQYKFTESQLIDTALTKNFTSLKELFNLSTTSTKKNRLQITEIAINEGSTKSVPNSVVTETVQNSLDAIRTHNPDNKSINLEIMVTGSEVVFAITDYVGINDKGIIATMIPFLSSKTPSEIVTGEMGSGFFNIYRKSKKVLIQTLLENKRVTILDTPVSQNERVIDINREVSLTNYRGTNSNQTSILAWYHISDPTKRADFISNYINMIKFTIGLIQGAEIRLNGKNIELPLMTLNSSDNFEFSIRTGEGNKVNSYIFTKGVPFSPLREYFEDKNVVPEFLLRTISNNCVLNIKHGIFTPVQTRGSLNISPENLALLIEFLTDSIYLNMLNYLEENKVNNYFDEIIPNFTSKASLNQLLFSQDLHPLESNSLKIFMTNYSYKGQPSFAQLINESNNIMGKDPFDMVEGKLKIFLNLSTYLELLSKVVLKWLSNKNTLSDSSSSPSKDKKQTEQENKNQKFLERIFTKFIQLYWTQGAALNITGFQQAIPSCQVIPLSQNQLGYYQPSNHSLTLNLNYMQNSDNFIETFNSKNLLVISRTDIFKQFLGLSLPASTLIHELEHARRNSTHNEAGAHDSIKEVFPGENPKIYTFEESANKVYDLVVRNSDILTQWVN
jgi:hypothetical protein